MVFCSKRYLFHLSQIYVNKIQVFLNQGILKFSVDKVSVFAWRPWLNRILFVLSRDGYFDPFTFKRADSGYVYVLSLTSQTGNIKKVG